MMAGDRKACSAPFGELFIYYVNGRLNVPEHRFGQGFVGNWEEGGDSFLFFSEPSDRVDQLVAESPEAVLADRFRMTYEEWLGGTSRVIRAGGFLVAPPWVAADPEPETIVLSIDPGVVFGNGAHPTTAHCLSALDLAFAADPPKRVFDLGTGTGVLAVAAARKGARRVLAVDLNLLAVRTAAANIRRNGCADRALVVQGFAEDFIDGPSDLVVANIHYDVMKELVGAPGFRKTGRFILSGLLRSQARSIMDMLAALPATIRRQWDHDSVWHTVYGEIAPDG